MAIAAVLAAIVVAAGLGALVGSGGRSRTPARKTTTTVSQAPQAAELVADLKGVVSAGTRGVKRLDGQRTAAAQALAAVEVERVYRGGVKQLATLPPVTRQATQTQSIDATLGRLADLYASLAAAARARSKARYASVGTQIASIQRTLRDEIKELA